LRDPAVAMPHHTAANEGTIMAVLESFRDMLGGEVEVNVKGHTRLREVLLAAVGGSGDRSGHLPDLTSQNWGDWDELSDCIVDELVWDHDFAMGDQFLDRPQNESRRLLESAGIDPDYYLETPPEPTERGLTNARRTLARLLGLGAGGGDGL